MAQVRSSDSLAAAAWAHISGHAPGPDATSRSTNRSPIHAQRDRRPLQREARAAGRCVIRTSVTLTDFCFTRAGKTGRLSGQDTRRLCARRCSEERSSAAGVGLIHIARLFSRTRGAPARYCSPRLSPTIWLELNRLAVYASGSSMLHSYWPNGYSGRRWSIRVVTLPAKPPDAPHDHPHGAPPSSHLPRADFYRGRRRRNVIPAASSRM